MNIAIAIDCWADDPKSIFEWILHKVAPSRKVYRNIKDFLNSRSDIQIVVIASYDNNKTSKSILNINKTKVNMLDIAELEIFLQEYAVENIFMCGCAWDLCVRTRSLGYVAVHCLIKKLGLNTNILVQYNCVKCLDESYFEIEKNKDWCATSENGIFRYHPDF